MTRDETAPDRPRVGVSSCLLGQRVRWNGEHKKDDFVVEALAPYVDLVPVCPEVEAGMGTPRPPVRLIARGGVVRMIDPASGHDHTDHMQRYAARRADALAGEDLDGYVLKKDSPSCGMERVRVHAERGGPPRRDGRGLFAAALMARLPRLPVEEEGRLHDAVLRENFIERLFAHRRLRQRFAGRWTLGDLVAFHAREKLLLLAHDPPAYQSLGRIVAGAKAMDRRELADRYQELHARALARPATRRTHVNVLEHMAGYFKKSLDDADRAEIREAIAGYRRGTLPRIVPLTLLHHHARRQDVTYLLEQRYLSPHPRELMLRNHA